MTHRLLDARRLDLVVLPVLRITYRGPYLANIDPADVRRTDVPVVEASQTVDYRLWLAVKASQDLREGVELARRDPVLP